MRMAIHVSRFPVKSRYPKAPPYIPRGTDSSFSIISHARILGAPERVPAGSRDSTAEQPSRPGFIFPSTWEQICMILEYLCIILYSVTSTDPNSAMRPISFLPKSTSILCSESSFSSASSSSSSLLSSSSLIPGTERSRALV